MFVSGPVSGFKPFGPAQLALIAFAIPAVGLLLASFVSLGLMQAMGIDSAAMQSAGNAGTDAVTQCGNLTFELLLLAMTWAVARSREKPLPWTGLSLGPWPKTQAFLPFVGLMILWQWFEAVLIEPKFPDMAAIDNLPKSQPALILSLITIAIVAPVAEELFFRGFLYTNIRRHAGFPVTILITAAYFSLLHYGNSIIFPLITLPFGLIAGLARERYGSVRPAIYLHVLWNLVAWGADYFFSAPPPVT